MIVLEKEKSVGLQRDHQEDDCDSLTLMIGDREVHAMILADGMGGYEAGEVAADLFVKYCKRFLYNIARKGRMHGWNILIRQMISEANEYIYKEAEKIGKKGMGCTGIVCILDDYRLFGGWIGDSRIYLKTSRGFFQISKDHSYVQQLLDSGKITAEEAADFPEKNVITRAVGVDISKGKPDTLNEDAIELGFGDIVLVCSDGLSGELENKEIDNIIEETIRVNAGIQYRDNSQTAGQICLHLIEQANKNGGRDNISVVIALCFHDRPSSPYKIPDHVKRNQGDGS